jgi:hypothetical protein
VCHPVEQWHQLSARTDGRSQIDQSRAESTASDRRDHEVVRVVQLGCGEDLHLEVADVAFRALESQTLIAEPCRACRTGQEGDITAGGDEGGAQRATGGSGTNNQGLHVSLLNTTNRARRAREASECPRVPAQRELL